VQIFNPLGHPLLREHPNTETGVAHSDPKCVAGI
jgi:hypothetical protein